MKTKPAIEQLNPYRVKDVNVSIKLDANESANYLFKDGLVLEHLDINLYPDTNANGLKEALGSYFDMNSTHLMVGSGSSELIELIIKTYVAPGDKVLSFNPSFTMYDVYTTMHGGTFVSVPVEKDLSYDIDKLITVAHTIKPKLIIVCTPNNPTGYQPAKADIAKLINNTDALVLLDEAYMDFTDGSQSFLKEAKDYDNLIVSRTFSKAFGLAGARLGYMSTSPGIMASLLKVKTPYNVNLLSQQLGVKALEKKQAVQSFINGVIERKMILKEALSNLGFIVYPSQANFLFVKSPVIELDEWLIEQGILIRNFASFEPGYFRISVGSESDNRALINALKEVL